MRYLKSDIKFDNEILTNGTAIAYRYKKGSFKGSNEKKNAIIVFNAGHGLQIVEYSFMKKSKHSWLSIEDYLNGDLIIKVLK